MRSPVIVFYSKPRCPLCEEAKAALEMVIEPLQLSFKEVDIYQDDKLLDAYQLRIPVITLNGQVIAEGRVSVEALQEIFTR
ncbi:glutaredoxin family protein [Pullulanibacillus sp. KACC 23026]|uniref:glutaredoxin family protein n=1 Tax=Pullulanibacillus sp. KACC 23026 TaxID=3028315 RepID=UPI0023AFDBD9|nr:glutaredoxin family protein [Pullulanibacillus sp. KACC 23026]WEG13637.1 glutaredoxin family protein [Pullulanibacillus sp. KACC 23026]